MSPSACHTGNPKLSSASRIAMSGISANDTRLPRTTESLEAISRWVSACGGREESAVRNNRRAEPEEALHVEVGTQECICDPRTVNGLFHNRVIAQEPGRGLSARMQLR